MSIVAIYVGLDYHQNSIQVCVMDSSGKILTNQKCGNRWTEVHKIVSHFGPTAQVAIESCCGAADLAEKLRSPAQISYRTGMDVSGGFDRHFEYAGCNSCEWNLSEMDRVD